MDTKKIVVFGNCQADQLSRLLDVLLPAEGYRTGYYSNNPRTGNKKDNQVIIDAVRSCDILIYQPLSRSHGDISEENVLKNLPDRAAAVSFPYIFNSGVYSLCRAPKKNVHGYGMIYGEEAIIAELESGNDGGIILKKYQQGEIDFDLPNRFQRSLQEMKKRESGTDIRLTDYIQTNYRSRKLFITHNHPSNLLFFELIRQTLNLIPLPIQESSFQRVLVPDLRETNCPISPYDIRSHGYQFQYHQDWYQKGSELIELIIKHYHYETAHPGKTLREEPVLSSVTDQIKRAGAYVKRKLTGQ